MGKGLYEHWLVEIYKDEEETTAVCCFRAIFHLQKVHRWAAYDEHCEQETMQVTPEKIKINFEVNTRAKEPPSMLPVKQNAH